MRCLKTLGYPRKDRAADAELRRADANPRAIADFIDGISDIQDVEAKFDSLPDPEIELLDDARVDDRVGWQRRAIRHGGCAGAQAALRQEIG